MWRACGEPFFGGKPQTPHSPVALHGDVFVVGCAVAGSGVHMFSLESGTEIYKWPEESLFGNSGISAITFMNATTLAVQNFDNETIGLFTLEGVLIIRLATEILSFGLTACADGCLLVSDYGRRRVRVFSPTGDELNTSPFPTFQWFPRAVALHAEHAYILELVDGVDMSRVHVFE